MSLCKLLHSNEVSCFALLFRVTGSALLKKRHEKSGRCGSAYLMCSFFTIACCDVKVLDRHSEWRADVDERAKTGTWIKQRNRVESLEDIFIQKIIKCYIVDFWLNCYKATIIIKSDQNSQNLNIITHVEWRFSSILSTWWQLKLATEHGNKMLPPFVQCLLPLLLNDSVMTTCLQVFPFFIPGKTHPPWRLFIAI